jgi:peptidoglycan hydrolase CwlO-like protein
MADKGRVSERLSIVEAQTKSNEKNIEKLAEVVSSSIDKLTKSIDKSVEAFNHKVDVMDEKIDKLFEVKTKYEFEIKQIHSRLEVKREALENKADKMYIEKLSEDIKSLKSFIHKVIWWFIGILGGTIAFLLKYIFFTNH